MDCDIFDCFGGFWVFGFDFGFCCLNLGLIGELDGILLYLEVMLLNLFFWNMKVYMIIIFFIEIFFYSIVSLKLCINECK